MLQKYIISLFVVYSHFWSGTKLVPSSFLVFTSWFLILAKAFGNGYVVACSTARRSAAEKNEMSDHGAVPFLAQLTKHDGTEKSIKIW